MTVKTLTIDGKVVTALASASIFDVAWENGIEIPRLCHVGGLSEVGACRLCLVEVEHRPKLQAACMTKVEEGMVVQTQTDALREQRKMVVELLLAEGNHVCAVCVANGCCELQDLAEGLGIDHVRFEYQHPIRAVDGSHHRFGLDHNRCVLCTRCTRICDEVEGAHVWDVAGRGPALRIIADLAQPWGSSDTCTSCGKCVQVCPTGALFEKGTAVGQVTKNRRFLQYIVVAREQGQWIPK